MLYTDTRNSAQVVWFREAIVVQLNVTPLIFFNIYCEISKNNGTKVLAGYIPRTVSSDGVRGQTYHSHRQVEKWMLRGLSKSAGRVLRRSLGLISWQKDGYVC